MQTVRVREDLDSSQTWHRIEETFENVDGEERLVTRLTFNNDGTVEQDAFVDDVLRHRILANNEKIPLGAQIDPWDQIEHWYNADGVEQQVTTFYLSGKIKDHLHASAIPEHKVEKFNPKFLIGITEASWESVTVTYDPKGKLAQRDYEFVDSSSRSETYLGGSLRAIQQENGMTSSGGDADAWSTVVSIIGSDGVLARRITIWNDGSATQEAFTDGKLTATTIDGSEEDNDPGPAQPPSQASSDQHVAGASMEAARDTEPEQPADLNPQPVQVVTAQGREPAVDWEDLFCSPEVDSFVFATGG